MDNSLLYYFLNGSSSSGYLTSSVPLYLFGAYNTSSGVPLYMYGMSSGNANVNLYLNGSVAYNIGTVPLYTNGNLSVNSTLPLYLQGPSYSKASGIINLSTQGSTSGSQQTFGSVPLYLYSTGSSGILNLYLSGQSVTYPTSGSLNLFLNSAAYTANASVNLSLLAGLGSGQNPTTATVSLFIQGLGGLNGSTPANSHLNLFLQNNYNATTSGINLYSHGNTNTSGIVNMYLYGVQGDPNSNINMYLYGIGVINQNINLFARGYID